MFVKYKIYTINHCYWLAYVYFIILRGTSVPTNKFGDPCHKTLKGIEIVIKITGYCKAFCVKYCI